MPLNDCKDMPHMKAAVFGADFCLLVVGYLDCEVMWVSISLHLEIFVCRPSALSSSITTIPSIPTLQIFLKLYLLNVCCYAIVN